MAKKKLGSISLEERAITRDKVSDHLEDLGKRRPLGERLGGDVGDKKAHQQVECETRQHARAHAGRVGHWHFKNRCCGGRGA